MSRQHDQLALSKGGRLAELLDFARVRPVANATLQERLL